MQTHYQLSFTARQAMVFFVVCLVALGLSFFFGLMAGLSGRPAPSIGAATSSADTPADSRRPPRTGAAAASATLPSPEAVESVPAEEPTAPAVLQAFEDRAMAEQTPVPATPRRSTAVAPPGSGVWIQVASLASRGEAEALVGRLSKHGYHGQIGAAQTPKGRVFRVRVGPYRSEPEAMRASEKLRRQEKIRQTWVVREGG